MLAHSSADITFPLRILNSSPAHLRVKDKRSHLLLTPVPLWCHFLPFPLLLPQLLASLCSSREPGRLPFGIFALRILECSFSKNLQSSPSHFLQALTQSHLLSKAFPVRLTWISLSSAYSLLCCIFPLAPTTT